MIAQMHPMRDPDVYVFCTTSPEALSAQIVTQSCGLFREAEGVSLILTCEAAQALGLPSAPPHFARITLTVHSALEGVGLTAAVAGALAEAGIPCNMVAGFHHDHVFVPCAEADRAMQILEALQDSPTTGSR
ncbi:MAG: ACT domain-containing protein [Rhodobacteraceae bacterium]|nr:MAG: ACT domain-containing protein [Paracoccaceae bacterium]